MTNIKWTDDHNARALRCDANHRDFVEIIDLLDKSIVAGIDRTKLITVVDTITALAARQFRYEEEKFVAANYHNATTHKGVHKVALEMLAHFRNDTMHGDPIALALELLSALKGWILLHIQDEDRQCGVFLNSKGVCQTLEEETLNVASLPSVRQNIRHAQYKAAA
jgi:hemerythrin-like metal-binding protein